MNKIISLLTVLFLFTSPCFAEIMQDEFVNSTLKNIPLEKPQTHTKYNYESTKCVPIKLHITENIKNENYEKINSIKLKIDKIKNNNKETLENDSDTSKKDKNLIVGNAVPPLLAYKLAKQLYKTLSENSQNHVD